MLLVVWVVQVTGPDEPLPISQARLSEMLDQPKLTSLRTPDLEVARTEVPVETESFSDAQLDLLNEVAAAQNDLSIIGIGAGTAGDALSSIGLASGGLGEGPTFFGLGKGETKVRKICYVVDRSGSMVDELDYVKEEVVRSISRLHRVQQFHIIFFSGGPLIEPPARRFVHAIREYKNRAFAFLNTIEAAGSTEPAPAMKRAFKLGADMIYFLTDGEFDPDLVKRLRKWNKDQKVRIYTIAFINNKSEDLLRQIARENGGEYHFVAEDELE